MTLDRAMCVTKTHGLLFSRTAVFWGVWRVADTAPNPLIWGSGTFIAEQQERNAYLRQKETERAAAVLLLYPED